MTHLGHIAQLWRYPVKSMRGERCATVRVTPHGIDGDRRFAFESSHAPVGKPLLRSFERAAMLHSRALHSATGEVLVETPQGASMPITDPDLSAILNIDPQQNSHLSLRHELRPFTDVRPIALHSIATEEALVNRISGFDPRRLRSNIVLALQAESFAEDSLSGKTIRLGQTAEFQILERIPRCRMVSLDPETAAPDSTILRSIARFHEGRVGVYARAVTPGTLSVGDPVYLLEELGTPEHNAAFHDEPNAAGR